VQENTVKMLNFFPQNSPLRRPLLADLTKGIPIEVLFVHTRGIIWLIGLNKKF